jgi:hypothetical protein
VQQLPKEHHLHGHGLGLAVRLAHPRGERDDHHYVRVLRDVLGQAQDLGRDDTHKIAIENACNALAATMVIRRYLCSNVNTYAPRRRD